MSWISPWALFLGGIESAIHNATQDLKAPFRKVLRQKYQKRFNHPSLFADIANDKKDITSICRYYNSPHAGNGLFLILLMNEYKKQGKQAKLIITERKHSLPVYFEKDHGFSITSIDAKDNGYESLFDATIHDFTDVMTISDSHSYSKEYRKKKCHFPDIIRRISTLPQKEDVVYIIVSLFVFDDESKLAIKEVGNQDNVRVVYLDSDTRIQPSDEGYTIFFPHYGDSSDSKRQYNKMYETFPSIPKWIFKKNYYPYRFFVYQKDKKEGLYFMESPTKED